MVLEISHGISISTTENSQQDKSRWLVAFSPLRGQIIKHLPGYHWIHTSNLDSQKPTKHLMINNNWKKQNIILNKKYMRHGENFWNSLQQSVSKQSVGIALRKQMIWNFQCHLSSPSDEVKIYTVPPNAN